MQVQRNLRLDPVLDRRVEAWRRVFGLGRNRFLCEAVRQVLDDLDREALDGGVAGVFGPPELAGGEAGPDVGLVAGLYEGGGG